MLKKLLIRTLDCWCRKYCLKSINKEMGKYYKCMKLSNKYKRDADIHLKIAESGLNKYDELFEKEVKTDGE